MPRNIEEPVTTMKPGPGGMDHEVTTHPAFGQIVAMRVSGGANLYGSDFEHNAFMTIRIARSELHRNLSRDWHFAKEEIIEVALSEAQWATFVSAPNIGSGVPCTILHEGRVMTPGLPPPPSRAAQAQKEVRETLADSIRELDELDAMIDTMGLSQKKANELKSKVRAARQELSSNHKFVAESFDEHMEETVEKAKVEIHGYMTSVIQRASIAALSGPETPLPLQLEARTVEDDG